MGVLTVKLVKIDHLRDNDSLGKSDPYVKFELEKDKLLFNKTLGKHQSSKKKNDCNPVYNETFKFDNVPTMEKMKLQLKGKLSAIIHPFLLRALALTNLFDCSTSLPC